jgi:hypothetical protein
MKRLLTFVLLMHLSLAQGQISSGIDAQIDRALRRDLPNIRHTRALLAAETPWELDFGASYSDSDGPGSAWEVPLTLSYTFGSNFAFVSTGAIWNDDGSSSSQGADDFTIGMQHTIKLEQGVRIGILAAVVVPSGGEVGSTTAVQLGQFSATIPVEQSWSLGGSLALVHVNSVPASVNNTGEIYSLNLAHEIESGRVILKLKRKERGGTTGTTIGEFVYDFSVPHTSDWTGELIVGHGFTPEHKDNLIDFEFQIPF